MSTDDLIGLQVQQAQRGNNLVLDDLIGVDCVFISRGFSVFGGKVLMQKRIRLGIWLPVVMR